MWWMEGPSEATARRGAIRHSTNDGGACCFAADPACFEPWLCGANDSAAAAEKEGEEEDPAALRRRVNCVVIGTA